MDKLMYNLAKWAFYDDLISCFEDHQEYDEIVFHDGVACGESCDYDLEEAKTSFSNWPHAEWRFGFCLGQERMKAENIIKSYGFPTQKEIKIAVKALKDTPLKEFLLSRESLGKSV